MEVVGPSAEFKAVVSFGEQQLAGCMRLQELACFNGITFTQQEFARSDIQKGDTETRGSFPFRRFAHGNCGEPIVGALVHHTLVEGHAGRHHLGNAALHDGLGELGVFQLITDRHAMTCPHQPGQVVLDTVVRKTRQVHGCSRAIVALGEGDAQHPRCDPGIPIEGFVEIADAEEQHSIGELCLDARVLLHQRRFSA